MAQQKCLAHLRRHFLKLIKLPGQHNQAIGETFVNLIDDAFDNYRQWQLSGDVVSYNNWANQFKFKLLSTRASVDWERALQQPVTFYAIYEGIAQQWLYFLEHPEVPPDNNLAERSLRLAVTKRKISGGSRSMERFQDTANLLTVVQTCRRQQRSVIDFFTQALLAHSGDSNFRPSLLPEF